MHIELYIMQYPSHLPDMRVSKLLIKPQLERKVKRTLKVNHMGTQRFNPWLKKRWGN